MDITAVDDQLRFQVQIDYGLAHEHWLDNPQNANSWWRIRQQSNVLYLDTSTNGLHWDEQLYADDFPDVAHVEVVLGMNTWSVSTGSVSHVEFDNLNVQP